MKSILDRSFRYTPSFSTDLAKKFAKIRLDMQRQERKRYPTGANVVPLKEVVNRDR
jgi:hypothetical protein